MGRHAITRSGLLRIIRLRESRDIALAVARATIHWIALPLALVALPGAAFAASSGNLLYQFDVVARSGDVGVSTIAGATLGNIGQSPSINSFGVVAFQAGLSTGGNGLFVARIGDSVPTNINPVFSNSPTRVFSAAVQINNSNLITARDQVAGAPPANLVRLWDADTPGTFTTIARGGTGQPFDAVYAFPSGNDNGDVVFGALDAILGDVLATPVAQGNTSTFNKIPLTVPLLPHISDSGKVIVRAGGTAASPIRLYDNNLQAFVTIAGGGTAGFSTVGRAPSVNSDGSIVVFAGDRGNGGGIFASIDTGGARQILKIAGEGIANISALNPPDLGLDNAQNPIGFSSVELDSRVGVAHQSLDPNGLDGDTFVVAFIATAPTVTQADYYLSGVQFTGNRGIWTVRVDIFRKNNEFRYRLGPPMPVVQIGDTVNGSGPSGGSFLIDSLPALYDPVASVESDDGITPRASVAGEHYLVFWAGSGATNLLIRAKQAETCLLRVQRFPQSGPNAPWKPACYACKIVNGVQQDSGLTIGGKGCAMTGVTMQTNSLFASNQVNLGFTPLTMDAFMVANSTYIGQDVSTERTIDALNLQPAVIAKGVTTVYTALDSNSTTYVNSTRSTIVNASALLDALDTVDTFLCDLRAPLRVGVEITCAKQRVKVDLVVSSGPVPVNVMNVAGLPQAAAAAAISSAGLAVGVVTTQASAIVPVGKVISQNPPAGTSVAAGSGVDLVISSPSPPVAAPNGVGQTQAAATAAITGAGLAVGTVTSRAAKGVAAGKVVSQSPAAGSSVVLSSTVDLVVSTGNPDTSVISVVGETQANAQKALTRKSYEVGTVTTRASSTVPAGKVISQSPSVGSEAKRLDIDGLERCMPKKKSDGSDVLDADGLAEPASIRPGHYIVIAGKVGAKYFLADPGHSGRKMLEAAYGSQFQTRGVIEDPLDPSYVSVHSSGEVELTLTAPDSKRTGYDPATQGTLREIANGTYTHDALDDDETGEAADASTMHLYARTPVAGSYQLRLTEVLEGAYTVTIDVGRSDSTSAPPVEITGVAAPGVTKIYEVIVGTSPGSGTTTIALQSIVVPALTGLAQAAATALIAASDLVVGTITTQSSDTVPAGSVIAQVPSAGQLVLPQSTVALVISTGGAGVPVPDVVGQTQAAATTAITDAGLVVGTVTTQSSPSIPAGSVISQNPMAGTSVAVGSAVDLVISTGPLFPSTTVISSNANPSVFGQSVSFTATVTGTAPTGTVTVKDGATALCTDVALAGGQAPCSTGALTVGSHSLTAVYSGDGNNAGSTSPVLNQDVTKGSTSTTLSAHTPDPSLLGAPIAVTANVTVTPPGAGTPSGTITVSDGSASCPITLPATGCNLTPLAAGARTLTATYLGDGNFLGSASPGVGHTVNAATLDVDASITGTQFDALTDGLLVLRYLSGSTGSALTTGALGSTATRTDSNAIKAYLDVIRPALDIDGNGTVEAPTDGLLIMRYLFGLRGDPLIAGAFDPLGARTTATAIEAYLRTLLP